MYMYIIGFLIIQIIHNVIQYYCEADVQKAVEQFEHFATRLHRVITQNTRAAVRKHDRPARRRRKAIIKTISS